MNCPVCRAPGICVCDTAKPALNLTCGPGNKRPEITKDMRLEAARIVARNMVASGAIEDDSDIEGTAMDILDATEWGETDGYQLTAWLERARYWEGTMVICEELDTYDGELSALHHQAMQVWKRENPEGDRG